MWNDSIIDGSGRRGRGPLFVLSLLLHGLAIAAVVVVPLLNAGSNLAPLKPAAWVSLVTPAPPPLPKGGGGGRPHGPHEPPKPQPPPTATIFAPPADVPEYIPEEELTFGNTTGNGVVGIPDDLGGDGPGIVGGIPDGTEMAVNDAPTFINQAAKLIRRVTPIYPAVALAARIQGVVIVEATTDIYGRVREARVVSGQPLLNDAALQAVRQWVYEPYLSNGIPRPVTFTVTVTFSLSQN